MDELKIQNIEQPAVRDLLRQFEKRHEMNVVDVAEIISKLITTLKLDCDAGRPKLYTISGGNLGQLLGIGKGVVSQFMSVWNMPVQSKEFLRQHNLSLINAYHVSRIRGKDDADTIRLQKDEISMRGSNVTPGSGNKSDRILHKIDKAKLILNSIISSYKIPKGIFAIISEDSNVDTKKMVCETNIDRCINYLSPKLQKLPFLQKEVEFCNYMLEENQTRFCGVEITKECLIKQIKSISDEILLLEAEHKLPHIASLIMMKSELEKNV